MANKIFKNILLVALFVLMTTAIFVIDEMYNSFTASQEEVLKAETKIIAYGINKDGMSFLDNLNDPDYRVTVINKDGKVIFDNSNSDIDVMDNHLDRKEVIDAINTGYGRSTRQSSTLTEKLIYTAIRLDNGDVVRLSNTYSSIFHIIEIIAQPLLLVILLIVVVSLIIAYNVANRIVEPLNNIDLDSPLQKDIYKEIKPILNRISSQQSIIKHDTEMLERRRKEFETITENMNEGMVLMNYEKTIVDFNKAASSILNIDESFIGKNIQDVPNYDLFCDVLDETYLKEHNFKKININNRKYELEISPITSEDKVIGQIILFFDESYKEANETMRKEFAANVSHELKTPLQAISGYAELLKNGVVKSEDQDECLDKIYYEAQRMISLIGDIIKLSHLDDDNLNITKERIDLNKKAKSVYEEIKNEYTGNISIKYEGKPVDILANEELLESIIYNLIDNAIKYNKENGYVNISVTNDDKYAYLSVEDNGVGIPEADFNRIFERFYRVDKSHSKEVGGTGLGLSIVKHACILNDAQIDLESKLNEGSKFTVKFNLIWFYKYFTFT